MFRSDSKKQGPKFRYALRSFLFINALVVVSAVALGRAGGGHNYSSGSSSSSSSSSYSSSSSSSSSSSGGFGSGGRGAITPVEIVMWGIALAMLGVISFFVERKTRREYQLNDELEAIENRWRNRPPASQSVDAINSLKRADPSFDPIALGKRVETAFLHVQRAWSDQDLDPVTMVLSDGTLERFRIALALNRRDGFVNQVFDVSIHSVHLEQLREREQFDVATFAITASAIDKDIDTQTLQDLRKSTSKFTEYWTFVRKKGAISPKGAGILECHCPACGAVPLPTDVNRCHFCGTVSLAGIHDWILTEITQTTAPVEDRSAEHQFLAKMRAKDVAFNLQSLEDMSSAIFWRIRAAEAFQDQKYLVSLMPAPPDLETGVSYKNIGVGSAIFQGHRCMEKNGTKLDRISIDISWRAVRTSAAPQDHQEPQLFTTTLQLIRSVTAQTIEGLGMKALACHSCRGSGTNQYDAICKFCGTLIADNAATWTLHSWRDHIVEEQADGALEEAV